MIIKKFLMSVAALGLLALAPASFSKAESDSESYDPDTAFYIKGFYNGSQVHATEEVKDALKNSGTEKYAPTYKLNKLAGGGSLGYSFAGVRVEAEGLISSDIEPSDGEEHRKFKVGSNTYENLGFSHMTGTINAYYDMPLSDNLNPYVGLGAGMSRVTLVKSTGNNDKDISAWHIALQGKAGLLLSLSKTFVPYVGYNALFLMEKEYPEMNDVSGANAVKHNISHMIHNVEVGFLVPFNV